MNEFLYNPEIIFIDKDCVDLPLTQRVLRNAASVIHRVVDSKEEVLSEIKLSRDPVSEGKKYVLITRQKGDFVKRCPCTPNYIGCRYYIINSDLNCPLDCTYCILQLYLDHSLVTIHANSDDLWKDLDRFFEKVGRRTVRIGTGELGDSLVLDHLTERSKDLISYFRRKKNALFELKTKTVNIRHILKTDPADNIIIAWSLNSERMAGEEEHRAPSVADRIQAAASVADRGYRLAFHFDPLIFYYGWKDGYGEVIDKLFRTIKPEQIAWISLGSLRFPPHLKNIIRKRFPATKILGEEMIRGLDGKMRYFKPLRLELYERVVNLIQKGGGKRIPLYFCMECREAWKKATNKKPRDEEDVEKYLSSTRG